MRVGEEPEGSYRLLQRPREERERGRGCGVTGEAGEAEVMGLGVHREVRVTALDLASLENPDWQRQMSLCPLV